jgi:TonB family protein
MLIKILFLIVLFLSVGLTGVSAQDGGAPAGETVKSTSGGVINGRAVNLVKPAYPQAARAVKAQGAVNVQVTLDEEGNVISASAVSGHPLLRAAAVEAARQSKFKPTIVDGKQVKTTGQIIFNFVLPGEVNPTTTNQATNQMRESEQLIAMSLVMFLTSLKDIPGDDESDQILLRLSDALPASMKTDKALFQKLVRAESESERASAIDEIVASMRRNLTGTDAWMVDLGKQWGESIGEAFKIAGSNFRRDRKEFIKRLQGMNWLLESPPQDVSAESLRRIRAIAAYDNENDSITPDFIKKFFLSSFEFIDYVVGENKKKK